VRIRLRLENLQALLSRRNMSQNHWAIKLGLSRGHWSDIVRGKHPFPSRKTRDRLLEVLDVGFDDLFEAVTDTTTAAEADFKSRLSDRYLIDREIGQGGMGIVFLARDLKHGRLVAVKAVSPEAVSGIGSREFLKEIRRTAQLTHPNILPLFDSGEAAGQPFYVTPYLKDGSLRDRLEKDGRLSLDQALTMASGVAAALDHAHDQRVLHCDVKPENVLLAGDHAYVADFGISRAIHQEFLEWGRQGELDSSAGTPAYVSPEQAAGEPHLDGRSDVYSFGCMVFEMLSGVAPFRGTRTMQVVAKRFTAEPPDVREFSPEVPYEVAQSISRAMSVVPGRRYHLAGDFVDSLGRAAQAPRSRTLEKIALGWRRLSARVMSRAAATRPSKIGKGFEMYRSVLQDIRYAARNLRRSPGYSVVVMMTLAFGIAANTLVFSVLNPYFLRSLPFERPGQLVQLGLVDPVRGWDDARMSLPMALDYREQSRGIADLATYFYGDVNLTGEGGAERVKAGYLTGNMFGLLGSRPLLGRTFGPDEDGPGAALVVVLSYGLWQRRFAEDAAVVGRTIAIDGQQHTVLGVMDQKFNFPFGGVKMWLPMPVSAAGEARSNTGHIAVVRMAPGWQREELQRELASVQRRLAASYPEADGDFSGVTVTPLREALNFAWDVLRVSLAILLGSVGLALLIACVNVTSLTLARGTTRSREIAVRAALGAGRRRLIGQVMSESLLLAIGGGALGVLLAWVGVAMVGPLLPEDLYRVGEVTIDRTVLLFTLGVTVITPLLFGLLPAWTVSKADLSSALKEGSKGTGGAGLRQRQALVVFEIAMAVALVVGTGLMVRSLTEVQRVDPGFDVDNVAVVEVTPPVGRYPDPGDVSRYYRDAAAALAAVPGITEVGSITRLPLNHENLTLQYARAEAAPGVAADWPIALRGYVSPGYFATMGVSLVAGRDFSERDATGSPEVAVVSRQLAEISWPGADPVGRQLLIGDPGAPRRVTVVGVVGDVKHSGLSEPTSPHIYLPVEQVARRRRFVVARTAGTAAPLLPAVQQAMIALDPEVPALVRSMADVVAEGTIQWRLSSGLMTLFGLGALLLAAVGVYGVITYSVSQRRKEIGVRLALGATLSDVRRLFLGDGLRLAMLGLTVGLLLALAGGRLMGSLLFGVRWFDPITLAAAVGLFGVIAAVASTAPAIRAGRVDPMKALREE